jgi:hypothetical protein
MSEMTEVNLYASTIRAMLLSERRAVNYPACGAFTAYRKSPAICNLPAPVVTRSCRDEGRPGEIRRAPAGGVE